MRRAAAAVLFGVALAAALATPAAQQTPQQTPPVFRGGARTVPIYATVHDGDGGFTTDLTKDDFEVRDNGKLQTITQFTTALQPLSATLLIDGSGSMLPVFQAVLDAASSFIIRMHPDDRIRIGSFADTVKFAPAFTSNRDELLDYLKNQFNLRMANETRLWDAVHQSMVLMSPQAGRKVVFLFTDGYDTVSASTMDGIRAEATRLGTSVYVVAMWTGRGLGRTQPNFALQKFAEDTGGGFYELTETDEMNSTFTRIATELHLQYVLGFTPAVLDGKVHDLEVKVKLKNMKVRARRNYLATADGR